MTVEIDVRNVSKIFGRQVEKAEKLAAQGLSKEEILKKRVESNRKAYGEFLIAKLENIIAANK